MKEVCCLHCHLPLQPQSWTMCVCVYWGGEDQRLFSNTLENVHASQGRISEEDIGWARTKRAKHAKSRGVWRPCPPGIFLKIRCCENASGGL